MNEDGDGDETEQTTHQRRVHRELGLQRVTAAAAAAVGTNEERGVLWRNVGVIRDDGGR